MKRLLISTGAVAVTAVYFALAALPAFGDSSGSVAMSIEVAAPCVTISPASVAFPSSPFSTSTTTPTWVMASPGHSVTNCSAGKESVYAKGSNATGSSGASWTLASWVGVDAYVLQLAGSTPEGGKPKVTLTLTDQLVTQVGSSLSMPVDASLGMPVVESSGAGQTMSMSVTYTATL
jgi:hypothetical protein